MVRHIYVFGCISVGSVDSLYRVVKILNTKGGGREGGKERERKRFTRVETRNQAVGPPAVALGSAHKRVAEAISQGGPFRLHESSYTRISLSWIGINLQSKSRILKNYARDKHEGQRERERRPLSCLSRNVKMSIYAGASGFMRMRQVRQWPRGRGRMKFAREFICQCMKRRDRIAQTDHVKSDCGLNLREILPDAKKRKRSIQRSFIQQMHYRIFEGNDSNIY